MRVWMEPTGSQLHYRPLLSLPPSPPPLTSSLYTLSQLIKQPLYYRKRCKKMNKWVGKVIKEKKKIKPTSLYYTNVVAHIGKPTNLVKYTRPHWKYGNKHEVLQNPLWHMQFCFSKYVKKLIHYTSLHKTTANAMWP